VFFFVGHLGIPDFEAEAEAGAQADLDAGLGLGLGPQPLASLRRLQGPSSRALISVSRLSPRGFNFRVAFRSRPRTRLRRRFRFEFETRFSGIFQLFFRPFSFLGINSLTNSKNGAS